ncbi:MAG: indole-3-glycerol-phosphate synthase [Syntrophomonadaceae bacterium]
MMSSRHSFSSALRARYHTGKIPVIPDIKCRSPKEGDLMQGRDPVQLARALAAAGAPVLSVVSEPDYFGGSTELLQQIVQAVPLPVLRKDFIKTPSQLQETADLDARAVLLIASMLEKEQLFKLVDYALQLGLDPLVETHSADEIALFNELDLPITGINNRNIVELELDEGSVSRTESLIKLIKPGVLVVSESSISSPADVTRAANAGAHAVLVGTAILKAPNPVIMYHNLSEAGINNDSR